MPDLRTALLPSRSPARRALRVTWFVLRLAVVVGVVAIAIAWRGFGYTPLVVQSGSMEPKLPVGSMLFVEAVDPARVREGDVITFDPPGPPMRTTHRVVDVAVHDGRRYFVTKGDANDEADDWRTGAAARAIDEPWSRGVSYGTGDALVVRADVPWIGYATLLAARGWFRMALIALACAWAALIAIRWIWRVPADRDAAVDETASSAAAPEQRHARAS